jgi:phi13 family phage major tail protein
MSTIGLKNAHYASRTETVSQGVTSVSFGTPAKIGPAISAKINIEYSEAIQRADDGTLYAIKKFKNGTIEMNVDDLNQAFLTACLGAKVTTNGIIVDSAEDSAVEIAVGYQSQKANGKYRYVWHPRVKFSVPSSEYETKGDSINFKSPTITGTIMEDTVADSKGDHPWRYMLDEDSSATGAAAACAAWFNAVPTLTYPSE